MIIKKAVRILHAGGLVAFPTETVYGLGADACNQQAIHKVFAVKQRPLHNPLIVHLRSIDDLFTWAIDIPHAAYKLAEAFWPGPLTMVLKKADQVLSCLTGGQETVAVRVPNHPLAQSLLSAFGGGIVGPSANQFTHVSPTQAAHVRDELGDRVDLILDGGPCEVGLESTIVNLSSDEPEILRPGVILPPALEDVLEMPVRVVTHHRKIKAPGCYPLHYAPRTKTLLFEKDQIEEIIQGLLPDALPVAFVMHSESALTFDGVSFIKLSSDPLLYGRELYQTLRALDRGNYQKIFIEQVPKESIWDAIRDRLEKGCGRIG